MADRALHDSALGNINAHKSIWNRADVKHQTFKAQLEVLDSKEELGVQAQKTARKIQELKDRLVNEDMTKKTAKAEISIIERLNWNQELTDPSDDSIQKLKDIPKEKSEQVDPTRSKKKKLFA